MSYIGNQVTSVPHIVDTFGGDNATTTFGPLVRAPAGVAAIAVFISGSYQTPGASYNLNDNYITFVTPPGLGSTIVIHHLGNGTTTQVPSDGSVTAGKLANQSVTGPALGLNSISSNNFSSSANTKIFSSSIAGSIIFGG